MGSPAPPGWKGPWRRPREEGANGRFRSVAKAEITVEIQVRGNLGSTGSPARLGRERGRGPESEGTDMPPPWKIPNSAVAPCLARVCVGGGPVSAAQVRSTRVFLRISTRFDALLRRLNIQSGYPRFGPGGRFEYSKRILPSRPRQARLPVRRFPASRCIETRVYKSFVLVVPPMYTICAAGASMRYALTGGGSCLRRSSG